MIIINEKVTHTAFGEGKVVSQEAERLSVQFSEKYGTKQFGYPDVFEKYLKLNDLELQRTILEELRFKEEKNKLEIERRQQQYEEDKATEKLEAAKLKKKKVVKSKI